MTLWFLFATMTAAAIFAVLWPLGRASQARPGGSDTSVYADQLAEIDRDLANGLIAGSEAGAARIEISRRLLAAADSRRDPPLASSLRLRRITALVALVGMPVLALALYLPLGSPRLGDFPLAERSLEPAPSQPLDELVAKVEQHLEKNPTDGRGWSVIAPVLARLGRFDDAIRAYHNSMMYAGDSAERRADLGEVIAAAAGGVVTAEAKAEFEHALALNAEEAKARYFIGLAAQQDGRTAEAASIWRAMLTTGPADAPWRPLVQAALARIDGSSVPPVSDNPPSESVMAAAKGMSESDRDTMIRGMVERLSGRLKQNGDDVEGWLRLVRAYMVLGDSGKAKDALSDARQAVAKNADRLRQLNEGLKNLGLDG
jgi:cytochrome c-type biogenesis protein CcmH